MPQSERLLLGPGPSNPYPEAVAALTRPVLGHLDPEFLALLDDTMDRLRSVFRTKNALTLPISGTGSAGMEACFVNLLEPGDTAIVGVNGVFGERMVEIVAGRTVGGELCGQHGRDESSGVLTTEDDRADPGHGAVVGGLAEVQAGQRVDEQRQPWKRILL